MVAIAAASLVHLRPVTEWIKQYWVLHDEPRSSPPNSDAYNGSGVAIQIPTAASDAKGGDAIAMIELPPTSRKMLSPDEAGSPIEAHSPSKFISTGRCSTRKTPSSGSIDFMTHITSSVTDLRTVSIELPPTSHSVSSGLRYPTDHSPRRNNLSKYGSSTFPDVLDLLIIDHPDDVVTAAPPSTQSTASGDSFEGVSLH